jgi:hypothetical protein
MKINSKRIQSLIATSIICFSCTTHYRMTTTIHPDGSCLREIYAQGDSAFLAGNQSTNPYLFQLDSVWQISPLEVENGNDYFPNKYNVKIGKTFHAFNEISSGLQFDEDFRPIVAPVESFQKHFQWFYTYYSFKTVYPNISTKIPVPIDQYLNKSEQKLWFQGDFSACAGMNGMELKDGMDDIETQFWRWYAQNIYETHFEAICDFEKQSGSSQYFSQMQTVKDTIFQSLLKNNSNWLENPVEAADIYRELDKCFKTEYFSGLYKNNREQIDSLIEKKEEYLKNLTEKLFDKEIDYELIIPGKLLYTNAPVNRQDTLIWKVNALRFTADDYELIAKSRSVHPWAFVFTFLLLALSIYCLTRVKHKFSN